MKRTCQYCNSPLFDTDTVCWHCGRQQSLPIQQKSKSDQPKTEPVSDEDSEPELEPVNSSLILFYSGLMVVIIVSLLLITRSLAQSPTLALKTDGTEGNWVSLTAPDKSFAIEIPATWDWHFQEGGRESSSFAEILENDGRIMTAVRPLGDLALDTEYLLVAQAGPSLLVVARSERLNRLSPQQAAARLRAESFDNVSISEARLIQPESGEKRTLITLTHTDPPLQCEQHLVTSPTAAYLIAACSQAEIYELEQNSFEDALNSFSVGSR